MGLFHIGFGDFPFLAGVTVDRLIVCRLGLIDRSFAFMQRVGGLVEAGCGALPCSVELLDAVERLLASTSAACARSNSAFRAAMISTRVPARTLAS